MLLRWSRVPLLNKRKHRDEVVCAAALSEAGGAGYTWEAFVAIEACEEVWSLCRGGCSESFRGKMDFDVSFARGGCWVGFAECWH